jgi:hypothetical protein
MYVMYIKNIYIHVSIVFNYSAINMSCLGSLPHSLLLERIYIYICTVKYIYFFRYISIYTYIYMYNVLCMCRKVYINLSLQTHFSVSYFAENLLEVLTL